MCSLVWGIGTGSLAAITRIAPSISAAPASMLVMRLSWPGAVDEAYRPEQLGLLPQTGQTGEVE